MYFLITTSIHSASFELIAFSDQQQVQIEEQVRFEPEIENTKVTIPRRVVDFEYEFSNNAWLNEMNDFDRF